VAVAEAVAVALGAAYIVLAILQRRECWIAGGASTALYMVVFARAGLPMQAALQFLYVALAVYGWRQWRPGGALPAAPRSWPLSRHLLALAAVGAVSVLNAALAERYALSAAPLADSLGTWASVMATWLLARRYIESWLWWIVVDIGLAVLFASSGLHPTAALYLAFAALAVVGWRAWRRSTTRDDVRVAAIVAELGLEHPVVTPLEGGPANRSMRLVDARHDFVLRMTGDAGRDLGADLAAELAIQSLAAAHGLAPPIVLARPEAGLLVTRHVAGRALAREDLRDPAALRGIGAWMAQLHAIPPPALPPVDFGARAAGYLERLRTIAPDARLSLISEKLAARRAGLPPPARLVSCHHDLHHRNLIDAGGRLVAIDWEYAGPGDRAADLAACIGYHELGMDDTTALLAGYGDDGEELRARIESLGWIFACLCYGWNALALHAGLAIDARGQARLAARLAA
jgi:nicotinamide mononucleotide transporter